MQRSGEHEQSSRKPQTQSIPGLTVLEWANRWRYLPLWFWKYSVILQAAIHWPAHLVFVVPKLSFFAFWTNYISMTVVVSKVGTCQTRKSAPSKYKQMLTSISVAFANNAKSSLDRLAQWQSSKTAAPPPRALHPRYVLTDTYLSNFLLWRLCGKAAERPQQVTPRHAHWLRPYSRLARDVDH